MRAGCPAKALLEKAYCAEHWLTRDPMFRHTFAEDVLSRILRLLKDGIE